MGRRQGDLRVRHRSHVRERRRSGGDRDRPVIDPSGEEEVDEIRDLAPRKGADGLLVAEARRLLPPQEGQVGTLARHESIEQIAAEADKYEPGQIIVLHINSPGGLVLEGDEIET